MCAEEKRGGEDGGAREGWRRRRVVGGGREGKGAREGRAWVGCAGGRLEECVSSHPVVQERAMLSKLDNLFRELDTAFHPPPFCVFLRSDRRSGGAGD